MVRYVRTLTVLASCLGLTVLSLSLAGCGGSSKSTTPAPPTVAPEAAFKGQYVFSVTGTDPSDGDFAVAGTLPFDGAGKVTAGSADYNLGSGIDESVALTGSYTAAGSVALVTLTDGQGFQDTFTATISSTGPAQLSAFDGTGTGTLTAQTATSFTPAGTYTFTLAGDGQNALTSAGGFVVTGNTVVSGTETDTDGAVVLSYKTLSGVLEPVQASGRGQAALGGYTFAYYPVTANQIVLVGLDDRSLLSGTAQKM